MQSEICVYKAIRRRRRQSGWSDGLPDYILFNNEPMLTKIHQNEHVIYLTVHATLMLTRASNSNN